MSFWNPLAIEWRHDPRIPSRSTNLTLAIVTGLCVVLPFFFSYQRQTDRVALSSFQLPGLCPSRQLFNSECPGCGMTRSFISLAHGDLEGSLHCHRLGPLLYFFLALQCALRIWALARKPSPLMVRAFRIHFYLGWVMIGALFTNWLIGVVRHSGNGGY